MVKKSIIGLSVLLFVIYGYAALPDSVFVKSDGTGNRTQGRTIATAIPLDTLPVITPAAGMGIFIFSGTHTAHGPINLATFDGTRLNPIKYIGVKSTYDGGTLEKGDMVSIYQDTSIMPLIDMATFRFTSGDTCFIGGLKFAGDTLGLITLGYKVVFTKNIVRNTYASTSSRYALSCESNTRIVKNVFYGLNTRGINPATNTDVYDNFFVDFDDATNGSAIVMAGTSRIILNQFKNCVTAITLAAINDCLIIRNTFSKCGNSISGTVGHNGLIADNISLENTGDFAVWTTQTNSNYYDNNHTDSLGSFNLVDTLSIFRDWNLTTGDAAKFDTTTLMCKDSTATFYRDSIVEAPRP